MFENQELLTRKQAADMLACSTDTIDRLAADGIIRKRYLIPEEGYNYGRLPRIRKSEIEKLIAKKFEK